MASPWYNALFALSAALLVSCDLGTDNGGEVYDVDAGLPRFVTANYIGLDSIVRISRFRSGTGHDYSDHSESCRSLKHYFQPRMGSTTWDQIPIYAPVTGTVSRINEEWAGTQIQISSSSQPAFTFVLFHVTPTLSLKKGTKVVAGQVLGHHVGTQTTSDVAVSVNTSSGYRLVSWFDLLTDSLFAVYQARGVPTREVAIISRAERDAFPLTCQDEAFTNEGTLQNWIDLK